MTIIKTYETYKWMLLGVLWLGACDSGPAGLGDPPVDPRGDSDGGGAGAGAGGAGTGGSDAGGAGRAGGAGTGGSDAGGAGRAGGTGAGGTAPGAGAGGGGSAGPTGAAGTPARPDGGAPGDAGQPISELRGFWEGTTSQNLPLSFHVTARGDIPDMLMRFRLSLATATCTATMLGDTVPVVNGGFTTTMRVPGISVTPTARGAFSSPTAVTGTFTGHSGSYTILCGTTLSFGTGSLLSAGTFSATRVSTCGNGVVEKGEECDAPAGCDADCQRIPVCGDGFVDAPETCDDTNTVSGDGCSPTCRKEARILAYPTGFPATGQTVAGNDFVVYQITDLSPGSRYTVSTRNTASDIDLFVFDDAGLKTQLCRSVLFTGTESCSATPTGTSIFVVVDNASAANTSFTLDVAAATPPPPAADAGVGG